MHVQKQSDVAQGSSSKFKRHNLPELKQSDNFEDLNKKQDGSKIKRVPLSSDSALTRKVKEHQKIGKLTNFNSRSQSPISAGLVTHSLYDDDTPFPNSHQDYSDAPGTTAEPAFLKALSKPNLHRSVKSKTHLDERGGTRGETSQESSPTRTPSNSKGHSFSEPEQVDHFEYSSKNRDRSKDKRVFLPSGSALTREARENQKIGKNINLNRGSESSSSESDLVLTPPQRNQEVISTPISPQGHFYSPGTRRESLGKVQQSKSRAPSKSKELESSELAAFSLTSPDLPKFDVKEILKDKLSKLEKNRGRIVWTNLESGRPLTKQQRKIMVRVLVRWLYMNHASTPKSVTSDMKEGLAKSIVTDYPNLQCQSLSSENLSPWSHYYNRGANTGWIPNSARHIQKRNRSRKTTKKVVEEEQENSSEYGSDQIEALGQVLVNLRTKQDIFRGMQACFKTRKVERKRGETIDFFLNKYPHFKHFDGEVIFQEYSMMFSEARDLQRPFASKLDKILALEPVRRMDLKYDDDILRALILLSHQLPHDIPLPKEKFDYSWAREEDLFVILEPNDNITDYVIERMRNSAKAIQPYSILVQSSIDKKITSSFIVLDSKELEIQCPRQRPLLHALSVLMQCYCVFNVLHPFGWRNTLHFVQHYFMNIREKQYHRSSRGGEYTSSSEMELWERLQ
ncbi:uncharacterized protein LOC127749179 [Frankliniella occidentalis]|uniref:Uncharacterized protein LOC127749179 n=1 Tax=Frankliniella occidentalis TaxID=133901 RepID=A0A9C6WN90_FRAOC|nr:uncharacterized protein LOC127749179 [Frankliniella occidentalis]